MTMSLFTLQSRCTNPTKHPLHRPSVDQTVKSKQPPIHRLLPRIPFPVPSVQESPVEMEHVSTSPVVTATTRVVGRVRFNGYGRWCAVLSGNGRFSEESQVHPSSSTTPSSQLIDLEVLSLRRPNVSSFSKWQLPLYNSPLPMMTMQPSCKVCCGGRRKKWKDDFA